ncbi:hypothetical protein [Motilimonas sp. E26]|uniref:hypothetical protein n=1 Tax=Motilimonas sp. E26 TaxID=2865674 RepID=UPI001E2FC33D|nr:hypothetical protein [Motilimonas sp. E26]MCE0559396.1 hypothetical protein [Motilimonas sp. E26]
MTVENNVYADTAYRGSQCTSINEIYQASMLEHLRIDSQLIWYNQYSFKNPINWQFPSYWYREFNLQYQSSSFPEHWAWSEKAFKTSFEEGTSSEFFFVLLGLPASFLSFPMAWIWIIACWAAFIVGSAIEMQFLPLKVFLIFGLLPPIVACFGTYLNYWLTDKSIRDFKRYRWNGEGCYRRTGKVKHAYIGEANFTDCVPVVEHNVMTNGTTHLSLVLKYRHPENPYQSFEIQIFSGGTDYSQIEAAWDTLLRYMDVEQPLPDIPSLEPFRHLDPTTAAFDKAGKRGRPNNFWVDFYAKHSKPEWQDYFTQYDGLRSDNPIKVMEEEYRVMMNGFAPYVPPYIPEEVYQQRLKATQDADDMDIKLTEETEAS